MPRRNVYSIDFSSLPYSFQRRLVDLTPPNTLFNLRKTGHKISKITSLRGYFADSLTISHYEINYLSKKFKFPCKSRYLSRDMALTFKHVYVKTMLDLRVDVTADNKKLWSLVVPTYEHIVFAEDGYTIEEMYKFFHPKLKIWDILDSAMFQTFEKWHKFFVTMYWFIRSRKNAIICLLRCPANQHIFYAKIKGALARFCPTYRADITETIVIIERKR